MWAPRAHWYAFTPWNLIYSCKSTLFAPLVTIMTRYLIEWCLVIFIILLFPLVFRENVVVTCKIGSFLCSLDNLLQKNVTVFSFWKSNFKMALIWKKDYFWPTFHIFLVTRESYKNSLSTYLTHIHACILFTLLIFFFFFFCLTNFEKKNTNLSGMVSLWYESWCWFLFAPFWNNQ